MKLSDEQIERELVAIHERWRDIVANHRAAGDMPRSSLEKNYRLVIHPDLLNQIRESRTNKFFRFKDSSSSNYIYGLHILQDSDTEGWQIVNVSGIPRDKLTDGGD